MLTIRTEQLQTLTGVSYRAFEDQLDLCQHIGFKAAHKSVVCAHRRIEVLAKPPDVAAHDRQPRIKLLAQFGDFARLSGEFFLPPHRRHSPGNRDQIGRRRQKNLFFKGIIP